MLKKNSYNYEELIDCANGKLFGPGNAKLPSPPMLMFHRITNVQEDKGKYNKGLIEAEFDIEKKMWFFDCHFKDDPVMPGCLGLDAMWQLVGFYLGWKGEPGKGRALGVNSVKFTGEVLVTAKIARYEVNIKRILKKEGAVVGLADGTLYADGKAIYQTESLKVGLFKS
jgi:3-hydroxyacyl-[acyl-carrier protein] dehydratase / trans-2-decenoyl-[acyl-carrier protein] isomerase